MIEADFIVVGSGLTGSTIARLLADQGHGVAILERRNHIAGNVFDYRHESGITIHKYGPHYFRCNSQRIWDFLNRFTAFYDWAPIIKSRVNSELLSWPVNTSYVNSLVGEDWRLFTGEPSNFEEECLSRMPREIYEQFIKGYTEKQWGVPATSLSKKLAARITINKGEEQTLTPNHRWNALPEHGYTEMVKGIIGNIPVYTDFDYLKNKNDVRANKFLVFTGLIDEFFDYKFGKLQYRAQSRELEYFPDSNLYQQCVQVNYPDPNEPRARTLEWKHLLPAAETNAVAGTIVTHETPFTPSDPTHYEYPFPDHVNAQLYKRYKAEAKQLADTMICGRLGEYRYYDMDHAIGRAMTLADRILSAFS